MSMNQRFIVVFAYIGISNVKTSDVLGQTMETMTSLTSTKYFAL